jgi:hypothetical protein
VRALRARRGAALIAAAGSVAVIACLAACAGPVTSPAKLTEATAVPAATSPVVKSPVVKGTARGPVPAATANRAASQHPFCPPLPKGGLKLNPKFPLPRVPRHAIVFHSSSPDPGCAYVMGFSDVRKQFGAALLGPALVNLDIGLRVVHTTTGSFEEDSAGQFDFQACRTCPIVHGLPPARATFLAFGFEPISATLQLTEVGTLNLIGQGTSFALTRNTAWSLMELHVSDVKVNGKPLNVGPRCRTKRPILIKLTGLGGGSSGYSLQLGGRLAGMVSIPAFTGCGVTEDLDPLITGTVSGPGNYNLFTQGPLCTILDGQGCPPRIPKPLR